MTDHCRFYKALMLWNKTLHEWCKMQDHNGGRMFTVALIIMFGRCPMVTSIVLNSIIKNSEFNAGCEAETVQLTYYLIFFCSLFSWYASLSQAACTAVILAYIFTLPLLRNTSNERNKNKRKWLKNLCNDKTFVNCVCQIHQNKIIFITLTTL